MAEYQEALEKEKEPFLKEKAETLSWIAETEASLGVPISVSVPGKESDAQEEQTGTSSQETAMTGSIRS